MRKIDTGLLLLFVSFICVVVSLFFFSYTQVDLNLTLSKAGFAQTLQKSFQYIGYYQRPIATLWITATILAAFTLYGLIVTYVSKHSVSIRYIWSLIFCISVIGVFAYPAFSYDIFNYLFTAKTVLVYGKNPYVVMPLYFAGIDPWVNFMRWTHLVSAYTPLWILVSVIPFLLGFGRFLIILFNTKILLTAFYLLCAWGISKIAEIDNPKRKALALVVFALNPLVIIEAVVSPHNDIAMMAIAVLALYFYLIGKKYISYIFLALSVAVKIMTVFLYPAALSGWRRTLALCCMTVAVIFGFWRKELLPWYFLWVMPYVALVGDVREIVIAAGGVSLALILRYVPFIYYGDYSSDMQWWRNAVTVVPLVGTILWIAKLRFVGKKHVG